MSFMDSSIDVAVALGKGVYSVGQDVALGIQRTGEGLGLGSDGRIANIGYENRAMVSLLEDFFRYGSSDRRSPLYRSDEHTSELQSRPHLVCRLLLEKKKKKKIKIQNHRY